MANAVQEEDSAALIQVIVTVGNAKMTQTAKMANAAQVEDSVGMTPATVAEKLPPSQHQKHHLNPPLPKIFQRNLRAPRVTNLKNHHMIHVVHPVVHHVVHPLTVTVQVHNLAREKQKNPISTDPIGKSKHRSLDRGIIMDDRSKAMFCAIVTRGGTQDIFKVANNLKLEIGKKERGVSKDMEGMHIDAKLEEEIDNNLEEESRNYLVLAFALVLDPQDIL